MKSKNTMNHIILLFAAALLIFLTAGSAVAASTEKENVVRLGYYAEPGMMNGAVEGAKKSGYAYECMQEVAAHAGWRYSYVYGTFAELMSKLENGEIDILAYVSATEERRSRMLFPDYGMVNETFYLASLEPISVSDDFSEINGKRIGSIEGYYQNEVLAAFLEENGLSCEVVLYPSSHEKWAAAEAGEVDLTVESSLVMQPIALNPICRIGEDAPVYSAIAPNRPDLLEEFNAAQQEIDSESPALLSSLRVKYFKSIPLFKSLSEKDRQWIAEHKVMRIGVFNNDAPLIYRTEDGSVTGVMPDYVRRMFRNYGLDLPLEWTFYNSNDEALAGLRAGEIDVIHPFYTSYNIAEKNGVIISSTVYRSPMSLLYTDNYLPTTMERVATPYTRLGAYYVNDNYPESWIVPCRNGYECIEKMLNEEADSVILNSTALKKISTEYDKNFNMKTLHTLCNCSFAALPENSAAIDIINRAAPFLTDAEINEIEASYFVESDNNMTIRQFFRLNPGYLIGLTALAVAIVAAFIILMLLRLSERKQRAALEAARNAAEAANRSKSTFLFSMSHDIRTPMNAILGYTDMAIRHLDDKEKTRDSLLKIKSSGGHLLSLINDILEMSRIESGKVELSREPSDLRVIAENVKYMCQALAIPKSIDFQVNIGEIRNPYVHADVLHLNEVLINIISNAMKYTNEDGVVRYSVEQVSNVVGGKARYRFEVADNGIGMSEDFLKHIYEDFAREKSTTLSKQEGTGLGLSIVKRIVDLSGGTIDIQSKVGVGTTVTVEFPITVMNDAEIEAYKAEHGSAEPKTSEETLKGKRGLLVEDNEMNREIAEEILTESGLIIETAEDGDIALKMVTEKGAAYYDFILMDIQMPVMNGYDATMAIRRLPGGSGIPIIAVSANAFDEDRQKSFAAGMNEHIAKPIDVKALYKTLERFVQNRE